jgi:predicted small secreted protein
MKINKVEILAGIAVILILLFIMTGCNTVAGVGTDIKASAEWTKEKISQPKADATKQDPAR